MDVVIVAPCPMPYARGGAENLWHGLQDHINERTQHQAEVIKLPSREHTFWGLLDSYRAFAELDVTGFDVVVSGKYPAWMVGHPAHVVYMLHPLRGLYDTYHYFGLPSAVIDPPAEVAELLGFMADQAGRRTALGEIWERLDALRSRADALPPQLFAFPGALIRQLVQWLDGVGLDPTQIKAYAAISATVRGRAGYFPAHTDVLVAHPPSRRKIAPGGRRGDYLFTVSRLDGPKRLDVLVAAMGLVRSGARLKLAGSGPEAERLAALSAANERIELLGRVSDEALEKLYGRARAVAFLTHDEDFGLVTLEAMQAGRPVITCRDSGGPRELVEDGVTGLVVDPTPEAVAEAIDELWADRRRWRRMGSVGQERARRISWDPIVEHLVAAA